MHRNPVIVLIFTHKEHLEWFEQISLRQCIKVLGRHPIRLVCPEGLDLTEYRAIEPNLSADFIPSHWLQSLRAYNRLKILPWLYRRYADYEFMLTYELDAFVFRDELLDWCAKSWDYVGAPWFDGYYLASPDAKPAGVGNSGFSLRRTQAMLRVGRTWRYQQPAYSVLWGWWKGRSSLKNTLAALTIRNNFYASFNDYPGNEDGFWGQTVARRFSWFRVAPYEVARAFSFEANPSRLYRECDNILPFGCHKWMELEPQFWKEHIPSADSKTRSG